jgi:hypothetical protein
MSFPMSISILAARANRRRPFIVTETDSFSRQAGK